MRHMQLDLDDSGFPPLPLLSRSDIFPTPSWGWLTKVLSPSRLHCFPSRVGSGSMGTRGWVERKRQARLSWEFSDSFHQFTALKMRWLPPLLDNWLMNTSWVLQRSCFASQDFMFMGSQWMLVLMLQPFPLPSCYVFFLCRIFWLPTCSRLHRIQDRLETVDAFAYGYNSGSIDLLPEC